MDKLPEALAFQILSQLDDSADVARCRLAWKPFNKVSPDLRSINLRWPVQRYIESRSRVSNSSQYLPSPLKTIFLNLLSNLRAVESVHIGAENLPRRTDVEDKGNDLHLTDGDFIKEWLPRVSEALKSLSISDFWVQSRHHRSDLLSLVSIYCHNLLELEVKNAWLSVDNLNQMQMLTSLTLESIRLDDKELSQLNKCFPYLEVLNLIDVRGLKLPMIRLLKLKTCHWTLTESPPSLSVIAPNLITLTIKGKKPVALYVEAPLLCNFHLTIEVESFSAQKFENLKTVWLETSYIFPLLSHFPKTETVETLTLDSGGLAKGYLGTFKFTLERLFNVFRNMTSLCIKSRAWSEFEVKDSLPGGYMEGLKTFHGYLLMDDDSSLTLSLVACVLDQCINLVDVSLLIKRGVSINVFEGFICTCMERWPQVKWRWGMWGKGREDAWLCDSDVMDIIGETQEEESD